ncbi:MAG: endonuclease/exonuclease/phosphatase family protein [Candidatus Liberibacter ctenarytainae]|uniref:Endonuclease/exonuclease/phosphatase family protein n=1 Tax=Candidatus Liberibacter ctenarytainae TaxID=2020335 RepID=A0A937AL27_9HYPH|nr:endonuclease/exonuclease/phosphatase family protein [Candidatus Liberibacter ctenarytainae]
MIWAQKLRIASWNINTLSAISGQSLMKNSIIRQDSDYSLLQQYARELNPHIVALQEMGSYDAVKRIFPEDIWDIVFSGDNGTGNNIHTAIVIRKNTIKILKQSHISMMNRSLNSSRGDRKAIEILFEYNGEKFFLLNIHLKSFCFVDSLQEKHNFACETLNMQTNWLKEWIDQKKNSNIPFIIAGDFNRKINHLGNQDDVWKKITQNTPLIRFPSYKKARCRLKKNIKNPTSIDFFVMDQLAYNHFVQGSFSEFLYRKEDIQERGYRLSDHCPIIAEYNF